ncbi:MAG: TetR/AcrR family transcriptional regulator [Candidatus Latescibacteria bacterium]|nr:TetR/AcrR family transcriptional regulator [Candidatus Latescibacterota bacterium]
MAEIKDNNKLDAKERIYKVAIALFARKGYHAVGVREIAQAADVNISMVNYYYGEKINILKQIIDEAFEKYRQAVAGAANYNVSIKEHVSSVIRNFIKLFRENIEISMVAFNTLPFDIPEIMEQKIKWSHGNFDMFKGFFEKLGVDVEDPVQMSIIGGFLGNMTYNHFEGKYIWSNVSDEVKKTKEMLETVAAKSEPKCCNITEDEFYERYVEKLTNMYMCGVSAVTGKNLKEDKGK